MLMRQNRYAVPRCLFIAACITIRADCIIYNCMVLTLLWIQLLTFSWSLIIYDENMCYWLFKLFGIWINTLLQTSVSLPARCFPRLNWTIPQFCLISLCSWKQKPHLSADNLPILVWTALACSVSMETSSVEHCEKRQNSFDVSHWTSTCSARHFTQPRNDYSSRICPLINITLKHKGLHWPPRN